MRISDWSSDVCSSDLFKRQPPHLKFMPRLDIGSKATGLRDGGGQRLGRLVKRGKAVAPRGQEPPGLGHGTRPAGIAVSPPRGFGIAIRKRTLLTPIGGVEAQEQVGRGCGGERVGQEQKKI